MVWEPLKGPGDPPVDPEPAPPPGQSTEGDVLPEVHQSHVGTHDTVGLFVNREATCNLAETDAGASCGAGR